MNLKKNNKMKIILKKIINKIHKNQIKILKKQIIFYKKTKIYMRNLIMPKKKKLFTH